MSDRKKLDRTREGITHKFTIKTEKGERDGYITVNVYEDGTPGEVFINVGKEGTLVGGLMNCISILTSIALQYGVPLSLLCDKMMYQSFGLSGMSDEFKFVRSYIDYIFRWLNDRFLTPEGREKLNSVMKAEKPIEKKYSLDETFG